MQNLKHLGIVAGLVDELEIVEQINQHVGVDPRAQISPGIAIKAMILNGLGSFSMMTAEDGCWMLCFVLLNGIKQVVNLTDERRRILQFFGSTCRQYYLLC